MNVLFSRTEIKKLKSELIKIKTKGSSLDGVNGLYSAINNINRNNSSRNKTSR